MSELSCASCLGGVHLMMSTAVGGAASGKTTFYLVHKEKTTCGGSLAADVLARVAQQGEAREAAEARRLRKPEKKQYHEERAAKYRQLAVAGLGVPV